MRLSPKAERRENQFDTLTRPCEERVNALSRIPFGIDQRRCMKDSIQRPVRSAYELLVALCETRQDRSSRELSYRGRARTEIGVIFGEFGPWASRGVKAPALSLLSRARFRR